MIIKNNSFTLNKIMKYRNEIFGIAAIWVIMFHIQGNVGGLPIPILPSIFGVGNMGVDIFLLLSAIGLYHSYNKNTVLNFYLHRLKRVLLPYLALALPYFIWYNFIYLDKSFVQFVLNISTLNYWISGDHPTWYVAFVIVAYTIYPLLQEIYKKNKYLTIVVFTLLAVLIEIILWKANSPIYLNCERALSRIPIFLFGAFVAHFTDREIIINKLVVLLAFLVSLFGIVIFPVTAMNVPVFVIRYFYGFLSISVIIVYTYIRHLGFFKCLAVAAKWLGSISFECYIIHVFAIRIITAYSLWRSLNMYLWYLIIPILTIIFAKLFGALMGKLMSLTTKEKNK